MVGRGSSSHPPIDPLDGLEVVLGNGIYEGGSLCDTE